MSGYQTEADKKGEDLDYKIVRTKYDLVDSKNPTFRASKWGTVGGGRKK
jgi:hypothetical protein